MRTEDRRIIRRDDALRPCKRRHRRARREHDSTNLHRLSPLITRQPAGSLPRRGGRYHQNHQGQSHHIIALLRSGPNERSARANTPRSSRSCRTSVRTRPGSRGRGDKTPPHGLLMQRRRCTRQNRACLIRRHRRRAHRSRDRQASKCLDRRQKHLRRRQDGRDVLRHALDLRKSG